MAKHSHGTGNIFSSLLFHPVCLFVFHSFQSVRFSVCECKFQLINTFLFWKIILENTPPEHNSLFVVIKLVRSSCRRLTCGVGFQTKNSSFTPFFFSLCVCCTIEWMVGHSCDHRYSGNSSNSTLLLLLICPMVFCDVHCLNIHQKCNPVWLEFRKFSLVLINCFEYVLPHDLHD